MTDPPPRFRISGMPKCAKKINAAKIHGHAAVPSFRICFHAIPEWMKGRGIGNEIEPAEFCRRCLATTDCTCSGRLTSHSATRSVECCASDICWSARFASASMPQAMTFAPPDASLFAMARPIPVVPVTMATLFSNSFMGDCSLYFFLAAILSGLHGKNTVRRRNHMQTENDCDESTLFLPTLKPFDRPDSWRPANAVDTRKFSQLNLGWN